MLKSLMIPCVLDLSYYIPTKTAITNKAITAVMLKYMAKAINNKNKHLRRHAVNLIDNLELLQSFYFREYNLMSIAPVVRFLDQACTISKQFNNLLLAEQVQMMYAILNKEKTC